jgi:hypothetical protein
MNAFIKERATIFQAFQNVCWRCPTVLSAPRAGSLDE